MKVLSFLLALSGTANAQFFVDTYAGRYTGAVGNSATAVSLYSDSATPYPVLYPFFAVDGQGNKYIAPFTLTANQILKLDSTNQIKAVYGTVAGGFAGDGTSAANALFSVISAVAADAAGNLYISDAGNARIRKIDTTGKITTIAGTGLAGYSGDGAAATAAQISYVSDLAVDSNGNLFIADTGNGRVRKIDFTTGIITTVAGNGSTVSSGDGGLATSAGMLPATVSLDKNGNIAITEKPVPFTNSPNTVVKLREVDANTHIISTVPVAATWGLDRARYDSLGRILFTSRTIPAVFATDLLGSVTMVAGSSTPGYSGDGSVATAATFGILRDAISDPSGNVYLVDIDNGRIRRVDATTKIVTTIAGNGLNSYSGDGGPATNAQLFGPLGLATDAAGNLFIADSGNYRVRRVDAATHNITIYAGSGLRGAGGDGGAAIAAQVAPAALAVDSHGNLYISDFFSNRVRKVDATTQVISTIAGTGSAGFSGDGGVATSAQLNQPESLAVDANNNLYIADFGNQRVRKVDGTTGKISTVLSAANLPSSVSFQISPTGLAVDSANRLYVAIVSSGSTAAKGVILRITPAGVVSIYAGNGTATGEGVAGVGAQMSPYGLAIDAGGNLYYCDGFTVRRIDPTLQVISTVAGLSSPGRGYSGDSGPANSASFDVPVSLAASGSTVYVGDNLLVRRLYVPLGSTIITSSPSGLQVTADGITYITPTAFQWSIGSTHNVVFPTQQSAAGSSYTFQNWQDGQTVPQRFIIASGGSTYTGVYGLTALTLSPASFPDGKEFNPYSQAVTAVGGFPPYTITVIGGLLPPGLTFANNVISGTPVTTGSYGFNLKVTDSLSTSISVNATINIQVPSSFNGTGNPGIFRNGAWFLDVNGDKQWTTGTDIVFQFGQAGDVPVIGDWDNTGKQRVGIFRNGQWYVDINGDHLWTLPEDSGFVYGQTGDIPVVGDWDNTGKQRIGIFRNGTWFLDLNGDRLWTLGVDAVFQFGQAGDIPLVGDWDNTGKQRLGLFRNGVWFLDINGDHQWTSQQDVIFNFGQTGDIPLFGDWDNTGKQRVGLFRNGLWYLDINGDRAWSAGVDVAFYYGQAGDIPVPGK